MKVWLNGALVEDRHATVSHADRGLTVGDGVFETVAVRGAQPYALTRHLARLARSAQLLGLTPPTPDELRLAVAELLAAEGSGHDPARLRITVTAGNGTTPTVLLTLTPAPSRPPTAAVVLLPWARNENAPTTGAKTTSYADDVVALAYAQRLGGDEGVYANTLGQLCEGTSTNVFVAIGGRLWTPPLTSGCLAGITRELLLEWIDAHEETLSLAALAEADEAFLSSSLRGVQPISSVDGVPLAAVPGPLTRAAWQVWAERSAQQLDP